jgi:hypothetical protein
MKQEAKAPLDEPTDHHQRPHRCGSTRPPPPGTAAPGTPSAWERGAAQTAGDQATSETGVPH